MERGATGTSTSFTTSRVTSRVWVRPGPPKTTIGPRFGKPEPPDEGTFLASGFEPPDDFFFDEDPKSLLPELSTKKSTATITTNPTVTKTMMAVSLNARGMLYNSYP